MRVPEIEQNAGSCCGSGSNAASDVLLNWHRCNRGDPMLPAAESACFVIADISGYTRYLAGVELEHAQDIIADVINTLVEGLRPPFRVAKVEGDAVFFYSVTDRIDGSQLQDAIAAAYFAFRRRLRSIGLATTCECNACSHMQDLDLKFVAHFGEFIAHNLAGSEELTGRDVILVHRLLKNTVAQTIGRHAYLLYSNACIEAMEVDPASQPLIEHHETIDIIGDVQCWVGDLELAWEREKMRAHHQVGRDETAMPLEFDIEAPRQTVWEYFTLPELRPKWRASDEVREDTQEGRRGVGTVNHCIHGKDVLIEEVLDWHPHDHLTLTTLLPVPGSPKILMTYVFTEARNSGTHVEIRVARPDPKDQAFVAAAGAEFEKNITGEIAALQALLRNIAESEMPVEEASLPESQERFLTEPVHRGNP
jgi:uncharacterized protein YndB with AHSA1/START domain/class 3 adenylate cyclase